MSLRVDEQGFAVGEADGEFFPRGDEAVAVLPVAEAEVVAAFAEGTTAVVGVALDVAAEAEVVVVGRRVCRRDAVEGVHAAGFGRGVEFAAELVAAAVYPAAVEVEFAAHAAVGGVADAEDVVFVFVHGQLAFDRHGFAFAVGFVANQRFGEVAATLQVLLQGGNVGGEVGLAGLELDEALQEVGRERYFVEFDSFKGVAHAAIEDE